MRTDTLEPVVLYRDGHPKPEQAAAIIRSEIASITPCDTQEREDIKTILAWIDSGADLYRRAMPATPQQHLVAYFVCVDNGRILLVNHIKAGLWLPTGGHVEPDEHPRATVEREIEEELGISANFIFPYPVFITRTETTGHVGKHYDIALWYIVHVDSSRKLHWDKNEFHEIQWFTPETIPYGQTDPHMARFIAKLKKLCRNRSLS